MRRLEYQGSLAIADGWTAGFGAETEAARIRYNSQFSTAPLYARTGSDAVYAQVQGDVLPNLTVTAGARYEDNETYGGDTVGQVAAAWRLGAATIVRASYSHASTRVPRYLSRPRSLSFRTPSPAPSSSSIRRRRHMRCRSRSRLS